MTLRVLDLFSGIGGFSLGLERTGGFETVAFCEIDPYCRAVLRKHWPNVPCYDDVRTLSADRLKADGIAVDVICGGFPCQDISSAGRGAGIEGARSGLWSEYARLIDEIRPNYVIVENVAALLSRGLGRVLGDMAEIGYDAEWHCIPASAVGAPHIRDRVWIIAYPQHSDANSAGPYRAGEYQHGNLESFDQQIRITGSLRKILADANFMRELQSQRRERDERRRISNGGENVADATSARLQNGSGGGKVSERDWVGAADNGSGESGECHRWSPEPNVGRMAHGVSSRVDRLKCLGNAVVPQIPQIIGEAILSAQP